MNLKLKRLVRTPSSEQYALFDLDQLDNQQQPITIGKLDMHYTGEGAYGTMLFWDDVMRELSTSRRGSLIQALLEDIAQPMGVPSEFVVEFFAPTLDEYHVFHNLDGDELDTDGNDLDRDDLDRDDLDRDDLDRDDLDRDDLDRDNFGVGDRPLADSSRENSLDMSAVATN